MMKLEEKAALLRIFIGENDRFGQHPLYEAIVLKAREQGLGAVLRGPMGFGHSSRLHTAKILRLSEDLPVVVEIIDSEQNIGFSPAIGGDGERRAHLYRGGPYPALRAGSKKVRMVAERRMYRARFLHHCRDVRRDEPLRLHDAARPVAVRLVPVHGLIGIVLASLLNIFIGSSALQFASR
jgi:PII-like signaling protein